MTILAIVSAEKEGQIESKMIKARQMEEIREAKKKEAEARAEKKKSKLVISYIGFRNEKYSSLTSDLKYRKISRMSCETRKRKDQTMVPPRTKKKPENRKKSGRASRLLEKKKIVYKSFVIKRILLCLSWGLGYMHIWSIVTSFI